MCTFGSVFGVAFAFVYVVVFGVCSRFVHVVVSVVVYVVWASACLCFFLCLCLFVHAFVFVLVHLVGVLRVFVCLFVPVLF